MKILLTGDLHLGRSFQKEDPEVASRYASARMQALKNAVEAGNREDCECLVIAGDLYDKVTGIPDSLHKEVSAILAEFDGTVMILPGNHDYLDQDGDRLWQKFETYSGSNTRLFREARPYRLDDAIFYPCICHDKHDRKNALGWLKDHPEREAGFFHIGVAHGAVEGYSYDKNQEYYYMTEAELNALNMDAWLIGHTHVRFPADLTAAGVHIFNAGTPQQTDMADGSDSEVIVIELSKDKKICARAISTGDIRYVERDIKIDRTMSLKDALQFPDLDPSHVSLRVRVHGITAPDDYAERGRIYREAGRPFIKAEFLDEDLHQQVTAEMISRLVPDGSVLGELLNGYLDDPEKLDLAYELAISSKDGR